MLMSGWSSNVKTLRYRLLHAGNRPVRTYGWMSQRIEGLAFSTKRSSSNKVDWKGSFSVPALFSRSETLNWNTEYLRLFLPFTIMNDGFTPAMRTKGRNNEAFGYTGQFWKYLQIHRDDLSGQRQSCQHDDWISISDQCSIDGDPQRLTMWSTEHQRRCVSVHHHWRWVPMTRINLGATVCGRHDP